MGLSIFEWFSLVQSVALSLAMIIAFAMRGKGWTTGLDKDVADLLKWKAKVGSDYSDVATRVQVLINRLELLQQTMTFHAETTMQHRTRIDREIEKLWEAYERRGPDRARGAP